MTDGGCDRLVDQQNKERLDVRWWIGPFGFQLLLTAPASYLVVGSDCKKCMKERNLYLASEDRHGRCH
jgi:hypothetical protein